MILSLRTLRQNKNRLLSLLRRERRLKKRFKFKKLKQIIHKFYRVRESSLKFLFISIYLNYLEQLFNTFPLLSILIQVIYYILLKIYFLYPIHFTNRYVLGSRRTYHSIDNHQRYLHKEVIKINSLQSLKRQSYRKKQINQSFWNRILLNTFKYLLPKIPT